MLKILLLLVIVGIVAGLIWMVRGRQPAVRRRASLQKYEEINPGDDPGAHLGGLDKLKNNSLFWGVEMGQPGCEAAHGDTGHSNLPLTRHRRCHWRAAVPPCVPASSRA